jgi:hypothetical protein
MGNTLVSNFILIILFVIGFYRYPPLAAFTAIIIFGLTGAKILNAITHWHSIVKRPVAISLGIIWGAVMLLLARSLISSVNLSIFGSAIFYLGGIIAALYCGHSHALDVGKIIGPRTFTDEDAVMLEQNLPTLALVTSNLLYLRWTAVSAYLFLGFILWARTYF